MVETSIISEIKDRMFLLANDDVDQMYQIRLKNDRSGSFRGLTATLFVSTEYDPRYTS